MATQANQLSIDCYLFNSVGNAFVRKETRVIPLPAQFVPCSPGPDGTMKVYSKILYGTNFQQEAYVGQTISQLQSLIVNA
jgi:hypothetical protein